MSVSTSVYGIMTILVTLFCLHTGTTGVSTEGTPLSPSPFFPLLLFSLSRKKHSPDGTLQIKKEYDYIVVGGGAAGAVVAGRLSEKTCVTVLLLEAGPKPPLITEVPGLTPFLLGTDVDWKFNIVPQKNLDIGQKNKPLVMNSGKMLGGSGNYNSMIYVRGNHKNYDDWAAQGAKGWSYKDVLPYFLKLEDNRDWLFLDYGYHRVGGPITVQKPRFYSKAKTAFQKAAKELGYKFVDPNGAKQTGFYDYQLNMRNGRRCSSVKGYLVPAEHRPNLDIVMNATATKVLIKNKIAKGVKFYHNGTFQTVRAKKEVIVSGGTINTPKLLMVSGIGPKEELQKWNISVVVDLPVGKNLQDHGYSSYYFTADPQFGTRKNLLGTSSVLEYTIFRSGPLATISNVVEAFLNGLNPKTSTDFPNYELAIVEVGKGSENFSQLEPEVFRQYFGPIDGNRTFYICVSQHLQPKSRGTVSLRSSDPFDPPVLDPNYLDNPKDLDDIVEGLKMCKKIVNTAAVRSLGARPFETLMPGCEAFSNSDDDYFKCFAKRYFGPGYHVVGTSKMGDPRDPSTVVDPDLRVKGVQGLRVVDASVMPIIPSGNTNIPTMMVAEKASDIIKKSIKCNKWGYFRNIFN